MLDFLGVLNDSKNRKSIKGVSKKMVLAGYVLKSVREDGETLVFSHGSTIEKSLGSCLEFLNKEYRECERFFNDNSTFHWVIRDFSTGECFSGSCDLLISMTFIDLIPEVDLSQYQWYRG